MYFNLVHVFCTALRTSRFDNHAAQAARADGAETSFGDAILYLKNQRFAKTGSGQTSEKLKEMLSVGGGAGSGAAFRGAGCVLCGGAAEHRDRAEYTLPTRLNAR
jgi:hypothetical protein